MIFNQLSNHESLRDLIVALEVQVPAIYTIITATKHDSLEMLSIPYKPNSYKLSDKTYYTFKELYKIYRTSFYYQVWAKTNLKCKTIK